MKLNLLHLTPSTERLIERLRVKGHISVLFVCLGNICRSPAAEGVMKSVVEAHGDSYRWTIDSAGTGGWHVGQLPDHRMRVHARRRDLELTHRCQQIRPADFYDFDMVVGMDSSNLSDLRSLAPTAEEAEKIVGMAEFLTMYTRYDHVPDPYYEGAEGFELVLDLLENACSNLYAALTPEN
jgi:protein-tyrosine phosphatase